MKRPWTSPDRIAPVLRDVLRRLDSEQQLDGYRIWIFWDNEVGATIARRAQPLRFRNGILFVTVSSHSWMQELQFMKGDLCERLNARLGSALVRDIYFISGNVETREVEPIVAESEEELPKVDIIDLPHLDDPGLSAAFKRLAASVARRQAQRATEGNRQRPRKR